MRKIHHWAVRCLVVASFFTALPASAYLQFTYTSQPLPLASYLVEGEPWDINEIPLPPPAFTLSFTAAEQDLSLAALTPFLFDDFTFALISPDADYITYPILISPASHGQVALDADGNVASWDLMIQMTELITPETNMLFYEMEDNHVNLSSSSEAGDQIGFRFHPITWHGQWIQLVQLDITFADENNPGIWTVEKVAVPEPGMAGLLLSGFAGLLWARRRGKKCPRQ